MSSLIDHPPGPNTPPVPGMEDVARRPPWLFDVVRLLTGILVSLMSISRIPVRFVALERVILLGDRHRWLLRIRHRRPPHHRRLIAIPTEDRRLVAASPRRAAPPPAPAPRSAAGLR